MENKINPLENTTSEESMELTELMESTNDSSEVENNDISQKCTIEPIPTTREHISAILEKLWGVMLFLVALLFSSTENLNLAMELLKKGNFLGALAAMGGVLVIFLIVIAWNVNRWYKTTFVVEDYTITITRKTLNRMVRAISVANISNVNIEQNIFEMIMGTCTLKLDTSSLSTANETDVKLVLKKSVAAKVKDTIAAMMREQQQLMLQEQMQLNAENGQVQTGELSGALNETDGITGITGITGTDNITGALADVSMNADASMNANAFSSAAYMDEFDFMTAKNEDYDVLYTPGEIIRNCAVNTSILAVVFALSFTLIPIITAFADGGIALFAGATIGTILVEAMFAISLVWGVVNTWFADFDFRAKRGKDRIYVSCGLFKKKQYAVPIDKINAIKLESKLIGRLLGYRTVSVINVGGEGEDVDGMKILLAGKEEQLKERLAILLPEYTFPSVDVMVKQPIRVLVRNFVTDAVVLVCGLIGTFVGLSVAGAHLSEIKGTVLGVTVGVTAVIVVLFLVGTMLSYQITKLGNTEEYYMISRGTFGQTIVTIPYDKIQKVEIDQGPIERLLHVERANISILASMMSMNQPTGTFDSGMYEALLDKVRAHYIKV